MRPSITIFILGAALVAGCQTSPTTSAEVAARTKVIPPDGYGRTSRSVIAPGILATKGAGPIIHVHFALAGQDEIWMLCVATGNGVPANSMSSAYTAGRVQLPLVRLSHDRIAPLQTTVDRFTVVIPKKLLDANRANGLKLKLYGTTAETELDIPSWYVAGFLQIVDN